LRASRSRGNFARVLLAVALCGQEERHNPALRAHGRQGDAALQRRLASDPRVLGPGP
jgi:hypothetical protein